MTIYNRQYQRLLSSELLRYLLLGRLPNIAELSTRIRNALGDGSKVLYKYIPQQYKSVFNNKLYNKALNDIKFDIDTFHEELIQMFADSSSRLNFADLYHKVNSYELNKLQAELELLLFTVGDADFYFDGAFETFSDVSKIDKAISTEDIIDLSEECLSLPYGGANIRRIDSGSLIDYTSIPIQVSSSNVLSSRQIPNTKFGNIFTDTLSVWGQEIITDTNGPLSIEFTFPLNPDGEVDSEFFISRIEVVPHSEGKQVMELRTSNDDVNYLGIVGYENGVTLSDQKINYALDFETTLIQYVRVKLTKSEADEEIIDGDTTTYRYIFGLKRFAAMKTGRLSAGTYYSKPVSFPTDETIGKVSLKVNQLIPPGCSLNYSVAPVTEGEVGNFIPISPLDGDTSVGASKVVRFNSTRKNTKRFTVTTEGDDAPIAYGTPFQGKTFYRIGPEFDVEPIFGTNLLYRGYKSWARDSTGALEIINVTDTYVSFENTDLEAMYDLTTETPGITVLPQQNDVKKVQLQVSKPPYYDLTRGHGLVPQPGTQNSLLDTRPNYAIYTITHKVDSTRQSRTFTLGSATTQYLPVSNFIIQSQDATQLPTLALTNGTTYQEGIDYTFELIDVGGRDKPTGKIVIPEGSAFLDPNGNVQNLLLTFSFVYDPDITHKVSRIQGNNITLDHSSNTQYDSIEITYRFIPVAPSQIIKSSIRVSNLPSSSPNRIFYTEGTDYVVDPNTGGIQRIPTGNIDTTSSAYVQFSYRGSSDTLQTFTTWAYVSNPTGTQIKFDLDPTTKKNKLVVDEEEGESFFVNSREGLVNITKATSTPNLPFGWVQFIVRSKNPDTNADFRTNLVDQVIQLKDVNKKKIFKEFGYYFNEITCYREPLVQKSVNHLKVNTLLSDHNSFAIDSTTDPLKSYIVLNFQPNQTSEIYSKIPTDDADETNPPQTIDEDFTIIWNEKTDEESAPTQVVVKIDLKRNESVDGALTPKCFDYQLRVGT